MNDWVTRRIKDIALGVYDGPHATPPVADAGPVFLGIGNVTEDGHLDLSNVRHIDEADYGKWTKRVTPSPGDIVFTYEATLNRYAIIPEGFRGCLGRRMALIRPDTSLVDTRFLFYSFFGKAWRETIEANRLSGATVDRIPLTRFPEFPILLPPLETQRRIAAILGAYDDLIEVNRRRVAVLEEMARGLFEEWFVRFRFPGHEAVPLIDTPDGLLPEGWRWGTLGDFLEERRDKASPGAHLSDRRYVPIECIGRRSLALSEHQSWENAQSSLQLFERGDLLFGAMRAYFHKVVPAPFAGITRTTCFVLRPRSTASAAFALLALFQDSTVAYAAANSSGSTIPYAKWSGVLEKMAVPRPDDGLLAMFNGIVWPMVEQIMNLAETNEKLAASRDLLLPRLISGQLSVETAERALEAAA